VPIEPILNLSKKKLKPLRRYTLEELLVGMTSDKQPPFEDDWPVGKELI
jgi:hypothetical protein